MLAQVFSQVGMPSPTKPAPGGLWDSIMGPLLPLLSDAWYIILHFVMPLCMVVGGILYVWMAIRGNKAGVAQARGVILAVPAALFFIGAATIAANFVISHWGVPG